MLDFEISRSERRCSATDEELKPGEDFYSVIVPDGDEIHRLDFSEAAWSGPPADCIGWWKTQVPTLATLRMKWAPHDVMLHYFESLQERPDKQDTKYVLSLLMMRKRILAQRGAEPTPDGGEELVFDCRRNGKEYRVQLVDLDETRIEQIQSELSELLFCPGK